MAVGEIAAKARRQHAVYFLILPFDPETQGEIGGEWQNAIRDLAAASTSQSVMCILTTPGTAARLLEDLRGGVHYQMWISVKLQSPKKLRGALARHHAALLILTRYEGTLRHTKTRIAYSYCPFCDKTTKDYGGKKHTYDEYGTLMSDVWRDITCVPGEYPRELVERLCDLFGLDPYEQLYCLDLRAALDGAAVAPIQGQSGMVGVGKTRHSIRSKMLVCGDCVEVLKHIPSDSVELCFADPPYNLKKKYDNWHDALDVKAYFGWCDTWLAEMARILKPGCTLAVLNIPLWAARHFSFLRTVLTFQDWIVWEGLSLPVRMIMPANYPIVCFSKGRPRYLPGLESGMHDVIDRNELNALKEWCCSRTSCLEYRKRAGAKDRSEITDLWWDIHRLKHNSRRADHPCQLPPALMRRLICLYTRRGETVVDPFNGVGTTTLAAEQVGRDFIGIELSDYYHQIADLRHKELRDGIDPFRKRRDMPGAKNSPVRRMIQQKYEVPKKKLQLEVRRIAREIGRMPSRDDVKRLGRYPIVYYDSYFVSWGEVCAAARNTGMVETRAAKCLVAESHQGVFFEKL